jgi:wyosine [tRNA(Phe)-imidazoG37] synthetase (radical SAM superfamily)
MGTTGPDRDRGDVVSDHRRQWRRCRHVYPVISRRAKGLSIGVNLNPDKRCNFACIYCQVDRHLPRNLSGVDLRTLRSELELAMQSLDCGDLWDEPMFRNVPPELRRLNDVAFSGDGEPTCFPNFDEAVAVAADVKNRFDRDKAKIVVITNASQLRSEQVERALPILDADDGEIWAKLDAGSETYFQHVSRPRGNITLDDVVGNITHVATGRSIVIQTLWMVVDGKPPSREEVSAYVARIRGILDAGGLIKLIQMHTVARPPWEAYVKTLPEDHLRAIADQVRGRLPDLPVEVYPGRDVPPMDRPR